MKFNIIETPKKKIDTQLLRNGNQYMETSQTMDWKCGHF